jgi:nicotinamidase/pyrazinamidase
MPIPTESYQEGDVLLVIDVQKDFCPGGALPVEEGDRVVPVLNQWIEVAFSKEIPVVVSRDWHPIQHVSFEGQGGQWPPHCIQDTDGARFHPDLMIRDNTVVVTKGVRFDQDQNSAFDQTGLAVWMKKTGIRRLWVGGLAQDVCVHASVMDARKEGFEVFVIDAATRPVDARQGREALEAMRRAGARIV